MEPTDESKNQEYPSNGAAQETLEAEEELAQTLDKLFVTPVDERVETLRGEVEERTQCLARQVGRLQEQVGEQSNRVDQQAHLVNKMLSYLGTFEEKLDVLVTEADDHGERLDNHSERLREIRDAQGEMKRSTEKQLRLLATALANQEEAREQRTQRLADQRAEDRQRLTDQLTAEAEQVEERLAGGFKTVAEKFEQQRERSVAASERDADLHAEVSKLRSALLWTIATTATLVCALAAVVLLYIAG